MKPAGRRLPGPVEILDGAIEHVVANAPAALLLSVAPSLLLGELFLWALSHAHEIVADDRRLVAASLLLSASVLAKGVFVSAQLLHADAVLEGGRRSVSRSLAQALRAFPRAIVARSLWVLLLAAGLATFFLLPLLPLAVMKAHRPTAEASKLIRSTLLKPARRPGEGWSRIPLLQLLLSGVLVFLLGNVVAAVSILAYLGSGLPGGWQNVLQALSPSNAFGAAACAVVALSFWSPVAICAARFLEEDLEGRQSGRDLKLKLARQSG